MRILIDLLDLVLDKLLHLITLNLLRNSSNAKSFSQYFMLISIQLIGTRQFPILGSFLDQSEYHHVVLSLITDHHYVGNYRQLALHLLLKRHRLNVLTTRTNNNFLIP